MAKTKYKRTHFYSICSMMTDEEVHQVWEIVGNALDRNGFTDADGELSIRVYDAVSYTHLTLPTMFEV